MSRNIFGVLYPMHAMLCANERTNKMKILTVKIKLLIDYFRD